MMVPMSKPQSSLCVYSERAKMVVAVTWTLCQAKVNKGQKHCDEVVLHLGVLCINAVQYLGEGVAHLWAGYVCTLKVARSASMSQSALWLVYKVTTRMSPHPAL